MSRTGITLSIIALLPATALLALVLTTVFLDEGGRPGFIRNLFLDERAFEVTIDLTVEGDQLKITRKINCIPYLRWEGLPSGQSWRPAFRQFGERLKSGGAVIGVTPLLCGHAYLEQDEPSKDLAIPEGHIPYFRWVDNADSPGLIEAYISKDYFSRLNPRVRYHGMTARALPYDASFPANDPFDWSLKNGLSWDNQDHLDIFVGFYAWPIAEEEQWSKDANVADYLRSLDQAQVLPEAISSKLGRFSAQIDGSWFASGMGVQPGPNLSGSYRRRDVKYRLGDFLPLLKTGDGHEIKSQERDYLVFYPFDNSKSEDKYKPTTTFFIGDRALFLQAHETPAVYDPTTKTVYRFGMDWSSFPKLY